MAQPAREKTYEAEWEVHKPHPSGYEMRFGTQSNDEKSVEQNDRFATMCAAAALNTGGSKRFVRARDRTRSGYSCPSPHAPR
jgi:hypothetical protein